MSEPIIRKRLPCSRCGYDLEGLEAHARCPECGFEVVETLARRLDPAAESIARSPGLARTAWSVYLTSVGSFAASAIALAPMLKIVRSSIEPPAWVRPGLDGVAAVSPFVALAGALVGFAGAVLVLPWSRSRGVVRARVAGGLGFLAWGVLALAPREVPYSLAALGAAAAVAASTTPLLRQLVPHSKLFRTARHATQTTRELLISAAVAAGAGAAALVLADRADGHSLAATLAGTVAFTSSMLLVVGLGYRMVNSYWILRSVLRPAPTVDEILGQ
jgi:hypothetical protein